MLAIVLIALHLGMNAYHIAQIFSTGVMQVCRVYYRVPPQDRLFVKSPDEYVAIAKVRAATPENARILWLPYVWRMANYYLYPRKIFQVREYNPGEQAEIDPDFLKSHGITHVYLDPDRIYPVQYDKPGQQSAAGLEQQNSQGGKGDVKAPKKKSSTEKSR